jgi:hypothetical protein
MLTNAINSVDSFYRNLSAGTGKVKREVGAAYELAKLGLANPDVSVFSTLWQSFDSMSHKSKLVTGGITIAGISAAAWGIKEILSDEDEALVRQVK